MLAPQSLWDTIDISHKALLEAVSNTLQSPPFVGTQHVFTLPLSQREQASTKIYQDKSRISECRKMIYAARQTLEQLDILCASAENVLNMCTQPIGALPLELLQSIISLAAGSPNQQKEISVLSGVSRMWKSSVWGTPELFVSPNWNWPTPMLGAWISRAGARPLHVRVVGFHRETLLRVLRGTSLAAVPYLHRVQTIQVTCGAYPIEFPPPFTSILQDHPLPLLEKVVITGEGSIGLDIRIDRAPRLRTLHISSTSLNLSNKTSLHLRSIGLRVHTVEDLKQVMDVAESQVNPFHLSIYAHASSAIWQPLYIENRPANCWINVTSLCLLQFSGSDDEHMATLVCQLDMPNLISLELVELSYRVFAKVVEGLPHVTSRRVEKLLIASSDSSSQHDLILHLIVNKGQDDTGDTQTPPLPLPFPNIREFALRDFDPKKPCGWTLRLETIREFVEGRRGALEKLVLPSLFRPQELGTEGLSDSSPRETDSRALTVEEESMLLKAGNLTQIGYDFSIDDHGAGIWYGRY